MKRIPTNVTLTYQINLLAEVQAIIKAYRFIDTAYGYHGSERQQERAPVPRFWNAVGRLPGHNESCDGHMAWANFTSTAKTYERYTKDVEYTVRRVKEITEKILKGAKT